MRILLTGSSGQVGGALRQPLGQIGEVLAPDRSVLDLSHPDSLSAGLDELSPDLIINPAAYTAVDLAEDEREVAYRVNAEAPRIKRSADDAFLNRLCLQWIGRSAVARG
jgi:dTDP-4-dehydrorhamnose reductase